MAEYQATPQPAADPAHTLGIVGLILAIIPCTSTIGSGLEHRGVHHLARASFPEQQGSGRHHHRRRVARAGFILQQSMGLISGIFPDGQLTDDSLVARARCWARPRNPCQRPRARSGFPTSARARTSTQPTAAHWWRCVPFRASTRSSRHSPQPSASEAFGCSTSPLRHVSHRRQYPHIHQTAERVRDDAGPAARPGAVHRARSHPVSDGDRPGQADHRDQHRNAELVDDEGLRFIIGHEVGHVLSGHRRLPHDAARR